jgi:hypothetical protein
MKWEWCLGFPGRNRLPEDRSVFDAAPSIFDLYPGEAARSGRARVSRDHGGSADDAASVGGRERSPLSWEPRRSSRAYRHLPGVLALVILVPDRVLTIPRLAAPGMPGMLN